MSTVLDTLISRVHDTDPSLANALLTEIKKLQNRREYGLVYEAHAPEGVRLWNKKVSVGDIVNVLPPRGVMETKENSLEWKVASINRKDKTARVVRKIDDDTFEEKDVSIDDLVVFADFRQTIYPGLVESDRIERGDKDDPYHVLINGENFHALQAMLWCYAGKVDCIYIDPPYNTGAKDWKYNNDYVDGNDQYKHSKWLSFMEQRLKLAKKLLNPKNSVMIVTIDEKEYLQLGMLLEQMFPEAQIQMVSTVINAKGVARISQFSRVEEYIFFVQFGSSFPVLTNNDMLNFETTGNYKQNVGDSIPWGRMLRRGSNSHREHSENCFYPIFVDENKEIIVSVGYPPGKGVSRNTVTIPDGCVAVFPMHSGNVEGCWQLSRNRFIQALANGTAKLGRKNKLGQWSINYLNQGLLDEIESGNIAIIGRDEKGSVLLERKSDKLNSAKTVWTCRSHDASLYGSVLLSSFIGKRFSYPKSLYAVEDTIRFFVANKPNALIVDFFAGSGTTAHAVMLLNHLDGGHRRSISITNNEIGPDTEKDFVTQKKLRPTDTEWQKYGIAKYITWERIKAAMTGINTKGEPIKGDDKFTEEFPMSEGFREMPYSLT